MEEGVERRRMREKEELKGEKGEVNVVVMDLGGKEKIGREVVKGGWNVRVVGGDRRGEEIKGMNGEGIMV